MNVNHQAIESNYQAYLIRCHWVSSRQIWMTTIKNIQNGREHHFSDANKALSFIQTHLQQQQTTSTPILANEMK